MNVDIMKENIWRNFFDLLSRISRRNPNKISKNFNMLVKFLNSGGPKYSVFGENWHEASFNIKEQTQIFFWNLSSKAIYFDPRKISFLVFEEKSPQIIFLSVSNVFKAKAEKFWTNKLVDHQKSALLSFETKLFFLLFFCFSFKNIRRTNVVLVYIFENTLTKVNNP